MANSEASLADLEAKVARSESRILVRTVALVAVPVIVAAAWLWMTVAAVSDAQSELVTVEADLRSAKSDVAETQKSLTTVKDDLAAATKGLTTAKQAESDARASAKAANDARAQAEQVRKQAEREREEATTALKKAQVELVAVSEAKEKMSADLESYRKQIVSLQGELAESQSHYKELQTQLREAAKFDDHRYELNWAEVKSIAVRLRGAEEIFVRISELQQRGTGWDMSNMLQKGFNSPGFAEHVLRRPLSELERTRAPKPGDIVIYDSGYAMFYFEDRDRTRFVVGMTPIGIVALQYDFGAKQLYALRND